MTETKTPNAGEYWVSGSGLIAYVVGLTLDGQPAWQQKGSSRRIMSDEMKFFLSCFHHEPRCDSFEWVEPPAEVCRTINVTAGDGWRWVDNSEPWQDGDDCLICDLKQPHTHNSKCWRRRVAPVEPPAEVWPKYFVGKNWSDRDAYVRVDNIDAEFVWVGSDGTEQVFRGNTYKTIPLCVAEHSWREATEAEALARVKPHPTMDCPHCGEFRGHGHQCATQAIDPATVTPIESPDDWVEITDRDHKLRAGIDEFRNSLAWAFVRASHGKTAGQAGFLNVRCRRKDLPVQMTLQSVAELGTSEPAKTPDVVTWGGTVPETNRVPVRLFLDERNNVFAVSGEWPIVVGTQIKLDGNGFYVEGQQ